MRVVFVDYIAHDTGGFFIGPIPVVVEFVHREQNPAVYRFQAIPGIWQGSTNNHAHGVVEVGAFQLGLDRDDGNVRAADRGRCGVFVAVVGQGFWALAGRNRNVIRYNDFYHPRA